jgi:hypothetical protein
VRREGIRKKPWKHNDDGGEEREQREQTRLLILFLCHLVLRRGFGGFLVVRSFGVVGQLLPLLGERTHNVFGRWLLAERLGELLDDLEEAAERRGEQGRRRKGEREKKQRRRQGRVRKGETESRRRDWQEKCGGKSVSTTARQTDSRCSFRKIM